MKTRDRWIPAVLLSASILGACGGSGADADPPPAAPKPTTLPALPAVDTPAYEHVPGGDLVVLLAMGAHETLYGNSMGDIPSDLIGSGFALLSLGMPCHEAGENSTIGLQCWRERIEAGDRDLFLRFCAGLSNVLDELGATNVSIVGLSRGGYAAITCAAYDQRIRRVALLMPVTDLARLSEFDGYAVDQDLFGTDQFVPYLSERPVLVRIGHNDERVGTDAAVAFAESVGADLQVLPVDGHELPDDDAVIDWLLAQW